jgi:hypothetical protein
MTTHNRPSTAPTAAAAGGVAAMTACCTTHLLILTGALGGIGAFTQGGVALGAGAAVAAAAWLAANALRRRSSQPTACCPRPTADLGTEVHDAATKRAANAYHRALDD